MSLRPLLLAATLAAGLIASVWDPRPAPASLVIAMDTEAMVQQADHIAVVDVMAVKAAWDDKHERIITTVDLAVVESWKGSMAPAGHVKVIQPGGTVDDITMVVFGMSKFAQGERALVFLQGRPEGAAVVGMAQGKRGLLRDSTSGRWMVHAPDRAGAAFVRPVPVKPLAPGALPVQQTRMRPLDDLRVEVRELVLRARPR